ncbi:MAG: 50S ribosomal protein L25/general stress protein Ctc [Flavobacteriaceae bacterium]|nr:50S ribosomal protein L25/general stress protein Ctc [Flavobacteriaceae bacterium]|tara:strand:- start:735 stop:1418 length:684 start_codon:yes stop_codon:yes gene_type:complete
MKSIEITGTLREDTGKKSTNLVRKSGGVPCVLYGGSEIIHFTATEIGFRDLVYTAAAHTVVLNFGDKMKNAILQDIQFHPVSDKILHADFYELSDDKPVTMDIPVELSGSAPGVLNSGGILTRNKRKLRVKALPGNLPDSLNVDISELELGDKFYTSELESDDYELLHPDNTVVCQVRTSRASMALPEDEESIEGEEGAEGAEGDESAESADVKSEAPKEESQDSKE